MKVIFFGNRGSRAIGASEDSPFKKFGGDTTCVAVICGEHLISLDAGTGFYKWPYTLGLLGRDNPHHMSVLFSHYHDDHTGGLPQLPLLFTPNNQIDFYGPKGLESGQRIVLKSLVENSLAAEPRNPDLFNHYAAKMMFTEIGLTQQHSFMVGNDGDIKITTLPVCHGGITALGYRIDYQGQSFAMISDVHHELDSDGEPILDSQMIDFIKDVRVFCSDSHFTDAEFSANPSMCQGFGHSTGEQGVRLCDAARVPFFIAHHHNPNKTDEDMIMQIENLREYGRGSGIEIMAAQPSLCMDLTLSDNELRQSLQKQNNSQKLRYDAIASPGCE